MELFYDGLEGLCEGADDVRHGGGVIDVHDGNGGAGEALIAGNRHDSGILRMQRRFTHGLPKDFQFGMGFGLEAFDEHQIARREASENLGQSRFGAAADLMHLHPAAGGGHDHLARPGFAVLVGILARLIDIERVMRVFHGRDLHAATAQQGNQFDEQRRLTGAAPAGHADHARCHPCDHDE